MGRTIRWPLSLRIVGLAFLNIVLLAIALVMFAQWQFGLNLESIILGPVRDRLMTLSNEFASELDSIPNESRDGLLAKYCPSS